MDGGLATLISASICHYKSFIFGSDNPSAAKVFKHHPEVVKENNVLAVLELHKKPPLHRPPWRRGGAFFLALWIYLERRCQLRFEGLGMAYREQQGAGVSLIDWVSRVSERNSNNIRNRQEK